MSRERGPYYANPGTMYGQADEPDIKDYNVAPEGQPGLWCQWIPSADGTLICWDGGEKFYYPTEWMVYVIDHFLMAGAHSASSDLEDFKTFQYNHILNGVIDVQGEDPSDRWRLLVENNVVRVVAIPLFDDEEKSTP